MSSDIVILTSSNMNSGGVGSIYLNDLIKCDANYSYDIFVRLPFLFNSGANGLKWISRVYLGLLSRFGGLQSFRLRLYKRFVLPKDVEHLLAIVRKSGARIILTASSPELIWLGAELVNKGVLVNTVVWDAPEYFIKNMRIESFSSCIQESFVKLIKKSRRLAVISNGMRDFYKEHYDVDSVVIRHGVSDFYNNNHDVNSHKFSIVFAGSLYAKNEWNAFVSALSERSWMIAGKKIEMHFIGNFPISGALKPDGVVLHGEKTFQETMELLKKFDVGYLPYWIDEGHAFVAKTSFPGKLTAYTAAGLAIFNHAPDYSEAASFIDDFGYGVTCSTHSHEVIVEKLIKLIELASTVEAFQGRQLAYTSELSLSSMKKKLDVFLG